ncbi:uncharacterized protein MELLADRAFT_58717 [Melampsora larici-populina 98AG31]|uniref:Secreted protein n=1 Tax=Melampsora larici-populina (strain 98AG31 / pathotype 3-4-7) TaxID=747676 RepID=F4R4K6_MELLP|nr:uncharacterized protein MELLADRAFT_58717 [Melampsora larici-populina 98AG31]EGG12983.1 secreted protein [Melampsora larici-populina 98AG31]
MNYQNILAIIILVTSKDVSSSIVPAHVSTNTASGSHFFQTNESHIVWDPLTQQHLDLYKEIQDFHDQLLADYVPPDENGTQNLSPPQQMYMDYDSERKEKSKNEVLYDKKLTGIELEVKSRLDQIERDLNEIERCPNGQLMYKGKNVYTADQLKHIEKKVKSLKPGFDYVYLGDGKFVRIEKEAWDLSGACGRVRAFDSDLKTLLYETGYFHSNWSSLAPGDLTLAEGLLYLGWCIPYKIANHFIEKYWETVQEKYLMGLKALFSS